MIIKTLSSNLVGSEYLPRIFQEDGKVSVNSLYTIHSNFIWVEYEGPLFCLDAIIEETGNAAATALEGSINLLVFDDKNVTLSYVKFVAGNSTPVIREYNIINEYDSLKLYIR